MTSSPLYALAEAEGIVWNRVEIILHAYGVLVYSDQIVVISTRRG